MASRYKFGDLVAAGPSGEIFMVVAPYTFERLENDPKGPAVWTVGIDATECQGETLWWPEYQLTELDIDP